MKNIFDHFWRSFFDHFWPWVFGFIFLVIMPVIIHNCDLKFGDKKVMNIERKLPHIDNNGLLENRYFTYTGSYSFPVNNGGQRELDSLRNEAIKRLINEQIVNGSDTQERWFYRDKISDLIKDVNDVYGALLNKSNPVNVYFVLSGHEDAYDEKSKKYVYTPLVMVPKERYMRYPKDIGVPLKKYLDGLYVKEIHELNNKDTLEVVLTGVELDRNKFHLNEKELNEIAGILNLSPKSIGLFITDLISGHNGLVVDNFSSGEYELEGKMEAALVAFVKNFMNERPKGYEYDIYCFGYADERPMNKTINYQGGADFTKGTDQPVFLENLNGPRSDYLINENKSLSIARAYAGSRIIKQYVVSEGYSGGKNPLINIYYQGKGVMNTKNYDYARQIKIIIIKK
ncbi:MAG: hypothetical protein HGA49_10805 [Eubacteriaceae bacterium]|nr:hypothetical protein [Eubacteriaceae bacterium]